MPNEYFSTRVLFTLFCSLLNQSLAVGTVDRTSNAKRIFFIIILFTLLSLTSRIKSLVSWYSWSNIKCQTNIFYHNSVHSILLTSRIKVVAVDTADQISNTKRIFLIIVLCTLFYSLLNQECGSWYSWSNIKCQMNISNAEFCSLYFHSLLESRVWQLIQLTKYQIPNEYFSL